MRKTLKPGDWGVASSHRWSLFGYGFNEVSRGLLLGNGGSLCENPFFLGFFLCFFLAAKSQKVKSCLGYPT